MNNKIGRGFKLLSQEAFKPERSTKRSGGYDFRVKEDIIISPQSTTLVLTDVAAYMEKDEVLKIYIRSSLAKKYDLVLANGVGIIDADYFDNKENKGNIGLLIKNNNKHKSILLRRGDKVAQGIFIKYLITNDDNFDRGNERVGGFGSTKLN